MGITSDSANVSDSSSSESVKEPPPIPPSSKSDEVVASEKKRNPGQISTDCSREELSRIAHTVDIEQLAGHLQTDLNNGLGVNEAAARLAKDGPNKIQDTKGISVFQIFLRQVSNSLTIVLAITLVLSFSLDDYIEGAVIAAVVLVNIIVGFIQDYRAEQTILSLQALSSPECKVLRSSNVQVVKAETLVVGDVVQLSAGGIVPADVRLFDSMNLSTDEALLTGESLPISKHSDVHLNTVDVPIGDRTNMAYSASTVASGRSFGIVTATAMLTEVGKIAALLQDKKATNTGESAVVRFFKRAKYAGKHALGLVGSPLQVKLSKFALLLFGLAITLAIIVFSVSLWNVSDEVLIYGICVAIAIIPESLIAVLTLTIAVGTKAMAKSNIIIRRLSSLEAVGGVTSICSDKTGTLTQGKMIVRRALLPGGDDLTVNDSSNPFDPYSGTVESTASSKSPSLNRLLDTVSLCNMSQVRKDGENGDAWTAVGEPTEIALQVFAMRFQHGKPEAMAKHGRTLLKEFPFDSTVKRMTMVYSKGEDKLVDVFTKGATEALLPIMSCTEEEKKRINADAENMAAEGLRVLCLAYKNVVPHAVEDRKMAETELTFVGLIGMYDPPRAETAEAVRTCRTAGITVHMLTGDHIKTATAIAAEVGIIESGLARVSSLSGTSVVMAASDFDKLSDDEVDSLEALPLVIARCSPTTKVRMVHALHRRKAFCIMTGDGINDSPALKLADIGVAMGLNGSDVAKQAADMVLADDNFLSIVRAVREGRRLFDNIQKFLLHLLTSNIAQVVLLMVGLAFKDETGHSIFPLSPLEILWVNLVISSPLALGLGLEPAVSDIMDRPPRSMKVGIFTRALIVDKMVFGCTAGSLCLAAFSIIVYGAGGGNLGNGCNEDYNSTCDTVFAARSAVFAFLAFALLLVAWEVMDFKASLFNMRLTEPPKGRLGKIFSVFPAIYRNKFLFWSCIVGFLEVFPLIYIPALNHVVFRHTNISWEWGVVIGCVVVQVSVIELWKMAKRRSVLLNRLLQDRFVDNGEDLLKEGSIV